MADYVVYVSRGARYPEAPGYISSRQLDAELVSDKYTALGVGSLQEGQALASAVRQYDGSAIVSVQLRFPKAQPGPPRFPQPTVPRRSYRRR